MASRRLKSGSRSLERATPLFKNLHSFFQLLPLRKKRASFKLLKSFGASRRFNSRSVIFAFSSVVAWSRRAASPRFSFSPRLFLGAMSLPQPLPSITAPQFILSIRGAVSLASAVPSPAYLLASYRHLTPELTPTFRRSSSYLVQMVSALASLPTSTVWAKFHQVKFQPFDFINFRQVKKTIFRRLLTKKYRIARWQTKRKFPRSVSRHNYMPYSAPM